MTDDKKKTKRRGNPAWVKGVSGNPKGGPVLPPEAREVRRMTTEEIIIIGTKLFDMHVKELKARSKRLDIPVKEAALAKVLLRAIEGGDEKRLDAIFNRVIGKVKDVLELAGHIGVGVGDLDGLTLDEIRARRKELEAERDKVLNGKRKKNTETTSDSKGTAAQDGSGQGA